ncbi:MAG TPA: nickel insertion protein, partial [Candidatus Tectomicrobia bacterium]|nr:nickel insertion protein [Candidatus Tectomicrobia bacterium]
MSRVAYLDCFSGISGDMLLGALIGAGAPEDALRAELSRLRLPGWRLETRRVTRAGLAAVKVDVVLEDASPPHRRLGDVLALIETSDVPEADRERGAAVFRALAEAEARVHGVAPEEVEFHEVGAVDAIVDVMGAVAGLRLLGVDELYASALPAGSGA